MKINIRKKLLLKYTFIVCLNLLAIILFASLLTYNETDLSIFYFDSNALKIKNYFGNIGANIAAVMYFYFGLTSFLFAFTLCYISLLLLKNYYIKQHIDRTVGLFFLIISFSPFLYNYAITINAGGCFGKYCYFKIQKFFGNELVSIIINTLLLISVALFSRFSVFLFRVRTRSNRKLAFLPIINKVKLYIQPIVNLYNNVISFFTQSNNEIKDSLFEIEYANLILPDEHQMENDPFWQQYCQLKGINNNQIADLNIQEVQANIKDNINKKYELPDIAKIFKSEEHYIDTKKINKESDIQAKILEEKLKCFGILGSIVSIKHGPIITLFEYEPQIDTKISKILALEDDLAMALETTSIRILAPIPGKSVVGFEVANKNRQNVFMSSILKSDEYQKFSTGLPLVLGEDVVGQKIIIDLVKMPHLLVAGSTGSGKSVALNAMLISLLCKFNHNELKLILIDPKRLEFAPYADIAHLLFPIVTVPKSAGIILKWLTKEMEDRYEKMAVAGSKNIFDFNINASNVGLEKLPYIVVMIDELADLMMTGSKDIEESIIRIAQMARACGIHIIIATQRPSVDVITGLIKVNFPSRIAFKVASKIDSRTILDASGADKLLGRGDMLFLSSQSSTLVRLHGAYVSDFEISKVIEHVRAQANVQYLEIATVNANSNFDNANETDDDLYFEVLNYLSNIDEVSISLLQRKFRIGYNRSARLIELLELRGFVMPSQGVKPRKVIKQQK